MSEEKQTSFAQPDDDACGKLWEIYNAEAQRYDEGLIRSWKEDMDVTLVFSGLYSAVLATFVVESYKNLQEDYKQTSASLLKALLSSPDEQNTTQFQTDPFTASRSAVACNFLWFLSLIMTLLCAFLATFVQQWTRHFLHKTTVLRSSTARARLFSFLYFGLKNFGMHAIVDIIPSLLHLSLFSFFGGLFAFLYDVNEALSWLVAGTLVIIIMIYLGFTMLSVIKLGSPFQTPLSPVVWSILQYLKNFFTDIRYKLREIKVVSTPPQEPLLPIAQKPTLNLTDAIFAASNYHDLQSRESASLIWTIQSLNDDIELLPLIEALPDILYGPNGLRVNNFRLLKPLLETTDPHIDIIRRTVSLMVNAQNPWFSSRYQDRCQKSVPMVLWLLGYVLATHPDHFSVERTSRLLWFTDDMIDSIIQSSFMKEPQKNSITALARLVSARAVETFLRQTYNQTDISIVLLQKLQCFFHQSLLGKSLQDKPTLDPPDSASNLRSAIEHLEGYYAELHLGLLTQAIDNKVFRFDETNAAFGYCTPSNGPLPKSDIYSRLCNEVKSGKLNTVKADGLFGFALQYCQKEDAANVMGYIQHRMEHHGRTTWAWPYHRIEHIQGFHRAMSRDWSPQLSGPTEDWFRVARHVFLSFRSWDQGPAMDPFWVDILTYPKGPGVYSSGHLSLREIIKFALISKAIKGDSMPQGYPCFFDFASLHFGEPARGLATSDRLAAIPQLAMATLKETFNKFSAFNYSKCGRCLGHSQKGHLGFVEETLNFISSLPPVIHPPTQISSATAHDLLLSFKAFIQFLFPHFGNKLDPELLRILDTAWGILHLLGIFSAESDWDDDCGIEPVAMILIQSVDTISSDYSTTKYHAGLVEVEKLQNLLQTLRRSAIIRARLFHLIPLPSSDEGAFDLPVPRDYEIIEKKDSDSRKKNLKKKKRK